MKTYGELKTEVANWLNRNDAIGDIPRFVAFAEDDIYTDLRCQDNEFVYDFVPDLVGPPIVDPINPIELPDNFRELKLVTVNDAPLEHVSDQEYYQRLSNSRTVEPDQAKYFTMIERSLYIIPWPAATPDDWGGTTLSVHYYGTESLNDMDIWNIATNPVDSPPVELTPTYETNTDNNTTRLFRRFPQMYLAGALHYAHLFHREDQKAAAWGGKFQEALSRMRREARRAEFSGSTNSVSSVYA